MLDKGVAGGEPGPTVDAGRLKTKAALVLGLGVPLGLVLTVDPAAAEFTADGVEDTEGSLAEFAFAGSDDSLDTSLPDDSFVTAPDEVVKSTQPFYGFDDPFFGFDDPVVSETLATESGEVVKVESLETDDGRKTRTTTSDGNGNLTLEEVEEVDGWLSPVKTTSKTTKTFNDGRVARWTEVVEDPTWFWETDVVRKTFQSASPDGLATKRTAVVTDHYWGPKTEDTRWQTSSPDGFVVSTELFKKYEDRRIVTDEIVRKVEPGSITVTASWVDERDPTKRRGLLDRFRSEAETVWTLDAESLTQVSTDSDNWSSVPEVVIRKNDGADLTVPLGDNGTVTFNAANNTRFPRWTEVVEEGPRHVTTSTIHDEGTLSIAQRERSHETRTLAEVDPHSVSVRTQGVGLSERIIADPRGAFWDRTETITPGNAKTEVAETSEGIAWIDTEESAELAEVGQSNTDMLLRSGNGETVIYNGFSSEGSLGNKGQLLTEEVDSEGTLTVTQDLPFGEGKMTKIYKHSGEITSR